MEPKGKGTTAVSWLIRWQGTEAGASDETIEPHSLIVNVRDRLTGTSLEQHSLTAKWGNSKIPEMIKTQSSSPFRKTTFTPQDFRDSHQEGRSHPRGLHSNVSKPGQSHIFAEILLACKNGIHLAIPLAAAG